jgi:uncharacterized protein YndB with AHSA1/START domain
MIDMDIVLPGPPEIIWRLVTDWEHQDDWMLEARDFVVTSPHREGVGVEGEATVSIGGITTRDTVRVVTWEPLARLAIEHAGWVSGRGEFFITPLSENETHMYWQEELIPPLGPLGRIGLLLFRPLMRRVFQRDLKVLAGLVRAATKAS